MQNDLKDRISGLWQLYFADLPYTSPDAHIRIDGFYDDLSGNILTVKCKNGSTTWYNIDKYRKVIFTPNNAMTKLNTELERVKALLDSPEMADKVANAIHKCVDNIDSGAHYYIGEEYNKLAKAAIAAIKEMVKNG